MSIQVESIAKNFGGFRALADINLEVPTGELVALLGPSGSGKTTLLRIIAGLEFADRGTIRFHGAEATHASAQQRQVGFVFQHYALFRHLSVFENVAFGLRVRPRSTRPNEAAIRERVHDLLRLVQLEGLAQRYPAQLSGGQRQRVALARALAVEPKVLLLDEPFGALDAKVRQELRLWLRQLHADLHITSLFVTHDQEEALEVADRVVIMNQGRIEQVGTPEEVYDHPANPFVFHFLGSVNLFHGRLHQGELALDRSDALGAHTAAAMGTPAVGYVRPHDLAVQRERPDAGAIPAIIRQAYAVGPTVHLELERRDTRERVKAEVSKEIYRSLDLRVGDAVFVTPKNLHVFVEDYQI